jgi:hypothetical protein
MFFLLLGVCEGLVRSLRGLAGLRRTRSTAASGFGSGGGDGRILFDLKNYK